MTRRFVFVALLAFVAGASRHGDRPDPQLLRQVDPGHGEERPGPQGRAAAARRARRACTITQTATELTIERETQNGVMKTVYKLDGSESVNRRRPRRRSQEQDRVGRRQARHQRPAGTCMGDDVTIEVDETRSLEADGTMTVVTVR